jgi:hypothetical protein
MAQQTALSKHAEKIYAALEALGPGWHSRADLAAALNKRRLSAYEQAALDTLVESGRVIAEQHTIDAPIPQRWEYMVRGKSFGERTGIHV